MLYTVYLSRSVWLGQDALYCILVQECWAGTDFYLYLSRSVGLRQDTLLPVQEFWEGTGYLYVCPVETGGDRISVYLSSGVWLGQFVPADCEALWDGVRTSCILAWRVVDATESSLIPEHHGILFHPCT